MKFTQQEKDLIKATAIVMDDIFKSSEALSLAIKDLSIGKISIDDIASFREISKDSYIRTHEEYGIAFTEDINKRYAKFVNDLRVLTNNGSIDRNLNFSNLNTIVWNHMEDKVFEYITPKMHNHQINLIMCHIIEKKEDLIQYYSDANLSGIDKVWVYCNILIHYKAKVNLGKLPASVFNSHDVSIQNMINSGMDVESLNKYIDFLVTLYQE